MDCSAAAIAANKLDLEQHRNQTCTGASAPSVTGTVLKFRSFWDSVVWMGYRDKSSRG